MIDELVTVGFSDPTLHIFNFRIHEFDDLTGLNANHVIAVLSLIELEYGSPTFEVMPVDEAGILELREHPVNRCKANDLTRFDELAVNVFSRQVMLGTFLQ
jgi:hypothetical protein